MATPNVVPRADQEGGLGTAAKSWGKLFIENPTAGGTAAATISNLDVDQVALDINASNTTANIIDIRSSTLTTGNAVFLDIDNTSVTSSVTQVIHHIDFDKTAVTGASATSDITGSQINIFDGATNNAASTVNMTGQKITVVNLNASGTVTNKGLDVHVLGGDNLSAIETVVTDGLGPDLKAMSSANNADYFTIDVETNGATTLTTVDADASLAHLNMVIDGNIDIDSAASITIDAVTDITVTAGGTLSLSYGTAIVFNEAGADADFRIESDDETHMFFLDAGNNRISIGDSVDAPAATLEVTNNATAGATGCPVVMIQNLDQDQRALDINAANTTVPVINVLANDLTTASMTDFNITKTLTNNYSNLFGVFADWDYTKSGDTGDGNIHRYVGFKMSCTDSATSNHANSTVNQTGIEVAVDSANTNGANTNTCLYLRATDATTNYGIDVAAEDGAGADIIIKSSANVADYATIAVGAEGATTITTVDNGTTVAHLTLDIDGDLKIDNAGGDTFFYTNGNTDDFLQLTIGADGQATFTTVDANAAAAHIEFAADGNIILDAAGTITFEQGANSASMPSSDGKVVVQTTTMKVMPDKFIGNGDSGRPVFAADQQTNKLGIHQYAASDELYAHIEIPFGHTVTHVQVHMSSNISSAVTIMSYNYQTGATDNVTSTTADGNENKALSSNTIAGSSTQDLLIKVDLGADDEYLWGATLTLAVT